jgi:hypothetical protein
LSAILPQPLVQLIQPGSRTKSEKLKGGGIPPCLGGFSVMPQRQQ